MKEKNKSKKSTSQAYKIALALEFEAYRISLALEFVLEHKELFIQWIESKRGQIN